MIGRVHLIARMAILIALGVALSYVSAIPLFGARLFPAQAAVNVVAAAVVGPWYGAVAALTITLLRISAGTGTLLAVPGSVIGVALAGLLYRATGRKAAAMAGEVIGTGLLAALAAYPMAVHLLGSPNAAAAGVAYYIVPFGSSSLAGAFLGGLVLAVMERALPDLVAPRSQHG